MPFLYEKIDTLREVGVSKELPQYVQDNLNPNFELRPYQTAAFENFITYFESDKLCQKPTQTLFHMATGSGKTLIMAGLMLYLYKKGYRNFLFFVNLSNIVNKTKENFLNSLSCKYLFAEEIRIDGECVPIKEVSNFQYTDENVINICFTTTQGLHADMWSVKENSLSIDDFANQKVVLISDEAHHLNADTKKMNKDEEENYKSWEYTVHRIFSAKRDNVLLEFTATCDIKNPLIKAEYENKITSEEKGFVAYFKTFIPELRKKYNKVYLVRNERQLAIYSFDGGERFEPDYLLFLHKDNADGYEQLQVFIEPKGTHLVENDKWKENFLLEIEDRAVATKVFVDDNKYRIWGFHFFNTDIRMNEFTDDMNRL